MRVRSCRFLSHYDNSRNPTKANDGIAPAAVQTTISLRCFVLRRTDALLEGHSPILPDISSYRVRFSTTKQHQWRIDTEWEQRKHGWLRIVDGNRLGVDVRFDNSGEREGHCGYSEDDELEFVQQFLCWRTWHRCRVFVGRRYLISLAEWIGD